MAVKHIVMWDLRGETPRERERAARQVKAGFEDLLGRIPGLRHLEVGIDAGRVDYACDVVLYSVFDDQDALTAYATHPAHLRLREDLGDVRITRRQVDYVSDLPTEAETHGR